MFPHTKILGFFEDLDLISVELAYDIRYELFADEVGA